MGSQLGTKQQDSTQIAGMVQSPILRVAATRKRLSLLQAGPSHMMIRMTATKHAWCQKRKSAKDL